MEREQVVKIVDEVVEGLLEGGPGSGPQKGGGSGKNKEGKLDTGAKNFKMGKKEWDKRVKRDRRREIQNKAAYDENG